MDTVAGHLKVRAFPSKAMIWWAISVNCVWCEPSACSAPYLTCMRLVHQGLRRTLEVPRSVPGLVTERLLVMSFLGGEQAWPTFSKPTRSSCASAVGNLLRCGILLTVPHEQGSISSWFGGDCGGLVCGRFRHM